MNRGWMKTAPRGREQQQWQQVRSETDELKRSGGNVRADRAGPVLCLRLSGRVPGRIVRIERCRDQAERQQQSESDKKNREDLVATTGARDDHARPFFDMCSSCHEKYSGFSFFLSTDCTD